MAASCSEARDPRARRRGRKAAAGSLAPARIPIIILCPTEGRGPRLGTYNKVTAPAEHLGRHTTVRAGRVLGIQDVTVDTTRGGVASWSLASGPSPAPGQGCRPGRPSQAEPQPSPAHTLPNPGRPAKTPASGTPKTSSSSSPFSAHLPPRGPATVHSGRAGGPRDHKAGTLEVISSADEAHGTRMEWLKQAV